MKKISLLLPLALAVVIWAVLVATGLALRPALPVDETRYLAVAWEMWNGGNYLVPHLNGIPYHHKPPLLFWLMTLGWKVFGVSETWGRLVAPLFALGCLLLSARLAQCLFPKYPAVVGAAPLALIGAFLFTVFASFTFFDTLVTFFTLLGLLGVWRAAEGKERWGWGLFAAALGLGILSKGPVQLLNLAPAALLAPWWAPQRPASWKHWYGAFIFAVVIGAVIALAWAGPAAIAGGSDFAYMLFIGQTTERVVDAMWHERPWWWYVPLSFILMFPWLWWPAFWRSLLVRGVEREPGIRFCVAMVVPVFIAFSAISGKQPHYLLPMIAVFLLLLARHVIAAAEAGRFIDGRLVRLPPLVPLVAAGLVLVIGAVQPASLAALIPDLADVPPLGWTSAVAGLAVVVIGVVVALDRPTGPIFRIATFTGASAALVIALQVAVAPEVRARFDVTGASEFVAQAQADGHPIANVGDYHGQYEFAGRLTKPIDVIDADQAIAWATAHRDGLVITYPENDPAHAGVEPPLYTHAYRGRYVAVWPAESIIAGGPSLLR
jgi:4-amino-4-deoxy-L-arabinose transferase-like glycosyltransferase